MQKSTHLILPDTPLLWIDTYRLADAETGMIQDAERESANAGFEPRLIDACDCILLTSKVDLIKISTSLCSFRMLHAASVTEVPDASWVR